MNIDNNILNAFLTMMASVVLLGIVLIAIKKFFFKVQNLNNDNKIDILSRVNLNNKNSLFIVKIQNKHLLIGSTEKNVNLIAELDISENTQLHKPKNKEKNKDFNKVNNKDLSFKAFLNSAFSKNN